MAAAFLLLPGCEPQTASTGETYSLIKFSAPWCGPCRQQKPEWDRLASNARSRGYKVFEVNIDSQQMLADQYGVVEVPTYIVTDASNAILQTRTHPSQVVLP